MQEGATKLLFVSPERLGNSALLTALRNRMPLSLVVVDEAHCISEWGHSFRPSYFRLAKELNQNIVTRSVLAITATATKSTEVNLCNALQISSSNVMRDKTIRSNLKLHVLRAFSSTSDNPEGCARIVRLLQKGPLVHARSIIIFCAWKRDVESLTKSLLHAGINSEAYHAGRHHNDRDAIERAFRNGKLRVVVATLAFGMGIDISTVDAVIHASMPRSLEEYVQQIGRAGRNDIEANCYLYLIDSDFLALRSLAFSGMVEREGICVLMSALFEERKDCQVPYFQNLSLQKLSLRSDISEESIETLLAYLEDMMPDAIDILPKMPLKVKVSFYDGSPEQLALRSDAVKALLSLCPRPRNGVYSAMTSQLANEMKKPPAAVLEELQLIASEKLIGFNFSQEQGVMVKVLSRPDNPASLTDQLYSRYRKLVMHQVLRLDNAYRVFDLAVSAAFSSTGEDSEQSLRNSLDHYFSGNAELCPEDIEDISGLPLKELHSGVQKAVEAVCREVQELSQFAPSAIAVARILHGCGSPAMPARDWAKKLGSFWGCYRDVDFLKLLDACQPIVLRLAK